MIEADSPGPGLLLRPLVTQGDAASVANAAIRWASSRLRSLTASW